MSAHEVEERGRAGALARGAVHRDAAARPALARRSSRSKADFVTAVLGSCFLPVLYGRSVRLDGAVDALAFMV